MDGAQIATFGKNGADLVYAALFIIQDYDFDCALQIIRPFDIGDKFIDIMDIIVDQDQFLAYRYW